MRLIDGDAVMERIEQAYKDMGVDTHGIWNKQLAEILHSADVEEVREFLHSILGAITQSPTIDAVSVVHGKWKRKMVDNGFNIDWVCSKCGYRVMTDFVSYSYCPNCGARMFAKDTNVPNKKGADDE